MSDNGYEEEDFIEGAPGDDAGLDAEDDYYGEDGDDLSEDDWEAYDDEGAGDEETVPAPKKKSNLNKIIIAGAVVAGIAVFVMQLGGEAPPKQAEQQVAQQEEQPPAQEPESAETAAAPAEPAQGASALPPTLIDVIYGRNGSEEEEKKEVLDEGGIFHDPNVLDEVEAAREKRDAAREEQAKQEQQKQQEQEQEQEQGREEPQQQQQKAAQAEKNIVAPASGPQPIGDQTLPMPAALGPAETAPLPDEGLIPPPVELSSAVESPRMPEQAAVITPAPKSSPPPVKVVEKIVEVPASASAESSAALERIADRLDGIEEKVEDIDEIRDSLGSLEKRVGKIEKSGSETYRPAAEKESPVKAVKEAVKTTIHKTASPKLPKKPSRVAMPPWVLKSAQPGSAFVARQGEAGLLSVRTGDTLPGIGRVTSIHAQDGRWIVQGTSGQIVQ